LRITQNNQANFVAHARELIPKERRVPGCVGFDILHDVSDQDTFVMLERWQDQAALNRHLNSEDFARNEEGLSRFLDGEPSWEEYDI
jgi:quinol monooxygenase YgiN